MRPGSDSELLGQVAELGAGTKASGMSCLRAPGSLQHLTAQLVFREHSLLLMYTFPLRKITDAAVVGYKF